MGKNPLRNSMEESALRSELRAAALDNDYNEFQTKLMGVILYQSKKHEGEDLAESALIEEYAGIVMSTNTDISGNGRNVFMTSVNNAPEGKLEGSVLYKFAMHYNQYNEHDERVLSLVGQTIDAKGNSIYDYLDKRCDNLEDRKICKSILSRLKIAMDADSQKGHVIPDFIKNRFDECAKKAGFKINELYNVDMKNNNEEIFKAFDESRRPKDFDKEVERNLKKYGKPGGGRSGGRY